MRPISRWRWMMNSTVTVEPRTGVDGFGKPTYGTAVTYRAHLSRKRRFVRNAAGQEVVSGQAIYLDTADDVVETSRVTLSATDSHLTHPVIVAVERRFDPSGPHHVVIYME